MSEYIIQYLISVNLSFSAMFSDTVEVVIDIDDANDNIPVFSPLYYVGGNEDFGSKHFIHGQDIVLVSAYQRTRLIWHV